MIIITLKGKKIKKNLPSRAFKSLHLWSAREPKTAKKHKALHQNNFPNHAAVKCFANSSVLASMIFLNQFLCRALIFRFPSKNIRGKNSFKVISLWKIENVMKTLKIPKAKSNLFHVGQCVYKIAKRRCQTSPPHCNLNGMPTGYLGFGSQTFKANNKQRLHNCAQEKNAKCYWMLCTFAQLKICGDFFFFLHKKSLSLLKTSAQFRLCEFFHVTTFSSAATAAFCTIHSWGLMKVKENLQRLKKLNWLNCFLPSIVNAVITNAAEIPTTYRKEKHQLLLRVSHSNHFLSHFNGIAFYRKCYFDFFVAHNENGENVFFSCLLRRLWKWQNQIKS